VIQEYQNQFFLILFTILITSVSGVAHSSAKIDLSNSNLETYYVSLDDEWEFYWSEFLDPKAKEVPSSFQIIRLPHSWEREIDGNGIPYPSYGYASYRSTLILPKEKPKIVRFKVRRIKIAHQIYINGELVSDQGTPGIDAMSTVPSHKPYMFDYTISEGESELVVLIHVANFTYAKGGVNESILFGSPKALTKKRESGIFYSAIVMGVMLMLAFYYFSFWLMRKKDKSTIYYTLFCLGLLIKLLAADEKFIFSILPNIDSVFVLSLELFGVFFSCPILHLYVKQIFPNFYEVSALTRISKYLTFENLSKSVFIFLMLSWIFTSVSIHGQLVPYFEIYLLVILVHTTFVAVRVLFSKEKGAFMFAVGLFAFFITGVNDILHERSMINSIFIFHFGVFIFVCANAILLARRFAGGFNDIETFNKVLESSVNERTAENRKLLKSISEKIENERKFISREFHDSVNAMLVACRLSSEAILLDIDKGVDADVVRQKISHLIVRLNETYENSRLILKNIRPDIMDSLGGKGAIEYLLDEYQKSASNCDIVHSVDERFDMLNEEYKITIYRIIQEAMTNVFRHSEATRVEVTLVISSSVRLIILDNGKGYDDIKSQGIGIISMRERTLSLNGNFTIASKVSEGVRITADFPCIKN